MKVKGIKQGKTIELLENIDIPDGIEITVEIELDTTEGSSNISSSSEQERLEKLNRLFGAWSNQPDLDEIFAEIDQERHTDVGREIESLDS